jgi:hypothetical protein
MALQKSMQRKRKGIMGADLNFMFGWPGRVLAQPLAYQRG